MSAEYLTKKYISDHNIHNISVSSAGTVATPQEAFPRTLARLAFYGCDASLHHQRKITAEILGEQDLIICMAEHHRTVVNALGFQAVLFNEIAYDTTEDILDDGEFIELHGPVINIETYVTELIDYLHDAIPLILDRIITQ